MPDRYPIAFISLKSVSIPLSPRIVAGGVIVAYQDGDHIVAVPLDQRFYEPAGVYYIAPLTGSVQNHINEVFSAVEAKRTKYHAGEYEEDVWRPGFPGDVFFENPREIVRADKQSLFLLVAKMNDLLLTVEPNAIGLKSHGARIRELHLLACMEVENYLRMYIEKGLKSKAPARPTTSDYFRLKDRLHLGRYGVQFAQYQTLRDVRPFARWHHSKPTQSLPWYDGYNRSKHNRHGASHLSTLAAAVQATAAALILFVVRYGLRELFDSNDQLSAQIRNALYINLQRIRLSWYHVPRINCRMPQKKAVTFFIESNQAWKKKAFIL